MEIKENIREFFMGSGIILGGILGVGLCAGVVATPIVGMVAASKAIHYGMPSKSKIIPEIRTGYTFRDENGNLKNWAFLENRFFNNAIPNSNIIGSSNEIMSLFEKHEGQSGSPWFEHAQDSYNVSWKTTINKIKSSANLVDEQSLISMNDFLNTLHYTHNETIFEHKETKVYKMFDSEIVKDENGKSGLDLKLYKEYDEAKNYIFLKTHETAAWAITTIIVSSLVILIGGGCGIYYIYENFF
ncbi:MAG: hypothetical protein ACRC4M_05625 [Mycoplasma sp.]